MSKVRLSGTRKRAPRGTSRNRKNQRPLKGVASASSGSTVRAGHRVTFEIHRYLGISLSGGKNDKTWVALLEHYPQQNKLFLNHLFERIRADEEVSADLQLSDLIEQHNENLKSVSFDVPLTLPTCTNCTLKCPGYEVCNEAHIEWFWKTHRRLKKEHPNRRLFTPYTQRCVEDWIHEEIPELQPLQHALGANLAPLTARARFLMRRIRGLDSKLKSVEVFPNATYWRIGKSLGLTKSQLTYHRHSVHGFETRGRFLKSLMSEGPVFVYQQDLLRLQEYPEAFDAFLCALTGFFEARGQCEAIPKGFPKKEGWVAIPKRDFKFK